ncbi:hypothetical protein AVEN_252477-1 [Araneus ventricosus]|uniref:Uncharacterized protein n=1 Tax=Araneus ventricosus TaxID=182803 RepID=A0A4Y2AQU8_ARAVE|nr:hypothetical protein AVEN_252477-1 [Araneus ventricosus]
MAASGRSRVGGCDVTCIRSILPSFQGILKPTKNLNEYCGWTLHRRGTLFRWPEGLNDRQVKGSGLYRDLSTVPTGSCNCVCVLGRYSTTRCPAGRITMAINPQRRL